MIDLYRLTDLIFTQKNGFQGVQLRFQWSYSKNQALLRKLREIATKPITTGQELTTMHQEQQLRKN